MAETTEHQTRIELLQGKLDMHISQALLRGPMHGYVVETGGVMEPGVQA